MKMGHRCADARPDSYRYATARAMLVIFCIFVDDGDDDDDDDDDDDYVCLFVCLLI